MHTGADKTKTNPRTSILLALLIVLAAPAYAAYPNGYSNCKVVTTLHAMVSGTNDLTNYPLTLVLTDPALKTTANGGGVNNSNGYDIAFYPDCSGTGTALKWELESYSPTTGAIIAHVLRPALSHTTDDTIGMYYGGAFSSFQSTATAVWDSNYKAILHLPSVTDGAATVTDSTSNANHGTPVGGPTNIPGQVDGGGNFVAASRQYIDMGNTLDIAGQDITIEYWFNAPNANQLVPLVSKRLVTATYNQYQTGIGYVDSTGTGIPSKKIFFFGYDGLHLQGVHTTNDVVDGNWHYVAITRTAAGFKIYIDGVSAALTIDSAGVPSESYANAGSFFVASEGVNFLNGQVDEVRVSTGVARSADWILTQYRNQSTPATYISGGSQGSPGTYANGYTYCKVVTTLHTMVSGAGDLANYPLTVSLTDADLKTMANGGLVNDSSGYDIGFYPDCSGAGTALKWEVESYSPTTGALVAHVLRPTLSHTADDTIGMYYGGLFSSFQSTASAVWDANYKLVWHAANGGSLVLTDSTTNANPITNHNAATAVAGKIAGAAGFASASAQYAEFGSSTALNPAALTVEAWVNYSSLTSSDGYNSVFDREQAAFGAGDYSLLIKHNGKMAYYLKDAAGTMVAIDGTGANTLSAGNWNHLVMTYSPGGSLTGYVNGSQDSTTAATANGLNKGNSIPSKSGFYVGVNPRYLNASLDEIRVSSIARSPDWVLTEYRNQSAPGTYLSVGPRLSGTLRRVRHSVKTDQ
jgi:hypothetical protein